MDDSKTPRVRIKRNLRLLWLRSRERAEALKRAKYTCERCGVKKSTKKDHEQKIVVHHKKGIQIWDQIIDLIEDELLCDPNDLEVLCPECHDKETYGSI